MKKERKQGFQQFTGLTLFIYDTVIFEAFALQAQLKKSKKWFIVDIVQERRVPAKTAARDENKNDSAPGNKERKTDIQSQQI